MHCTANTCLVFPLAISHQSGNLVSGPFTVRTTSRYNSIALITYHLQNSIRQSIDAAMDDDDDLLRASAGAALLVVFVQILVGLAITIFLALISALLR